MGEEQGNGRDSMSYEEEPMSAATDESMGHVFQAMVRPAPITTARPSTDFGDDGQMTPRGPSAWKSGSRDNEKWGDRRS